MNGIRYFSVATWLLVLTSVAWPQTEPRIVVGRPYPG